MKKANTYFVYYMNNDGRQQTVAQNVSYKDALYVCAQYCEKFNISCIYKPTTN
jgi:hypothetical protein